MGFSPKSKNTNNKTWRHLRQAVYKGRKMGDESSNPTAEGLEKALLDLVIESWRFTKLFQIAENSGFLKKNFLLLQAKRLKRFELDIWEKVDEIWAISDIDCGNISKMVPGKAVKSLAIGLDAGEFEARELSSKQSGFIHRKHGMDAQFGRIGMVRERDISSRTQS